MSITLITAVPGGGKTIYAVWHIIKPALEKGRVVYTAAIPELKLSTIKVSYNAIRSWHERVVIENNPDVPIDEQPQKLTNFEEGSIIVIDEVQNLWPNNGSKEVTDDINYLTKHRHHGLEIVLITQSPQLVHPKVLACVDKHMHIRKTWHGRQIFEWPEYCNTVRAVSSRINAVKKGYKIPTEAFGLYRSASIHVKPKMSVPIFAYIFPIILLTAIYMGYGFISKFTKKDEIAEIAKTETIEHEQITVQTPIQVPAIEPYEPLEKASITLVSNLIDWTKVSACVSNDKQCICYGLSAERLVIPAETCRLAVKHGWPGQETTLLATVKS